MATHSSVLVWRIPGTEKLGGLLSMGSHRVRHDWSDLAAAAATAAAAMENSMEIQYGSVKSRSIISSHIWVFTPNNWSGSRRDTCTPQVDCSGIQNSQDREATQVSTESEVKSLSHVRLFVTPWTVAHQAPPSMGFSRQEYWNGLSFPSLGDLPTQGLNPGLPHCRQMQAQMLWATREASERWMDKETVVYTHEGILFCLKKKKKAVLLFATAWGDLEDIILSEKSQTQKDQHCMILYAWNLKSWTCRSRE